MGQQEIIDLLKKKPRLTTKEIAIILNRNLQSVCDCISSMIKYKEIKAEKPTEKEMKEIIKKFPSPTNTKEFRRKKLRVFYVKNE